MSRLVRVVSVLMPSFDFFVLEGRAEERRQACPHTYREGGSVEKRMWRFLTQASSDAFLGPAG